MSVDRIALNLRLPASLHQGLVELARREYRSLNDQIVSILARTVLDGLHPQRDDWHTVVANAATSLERYLGLWDARYPPSAAQPSQPVERFLMEMVYPGDASAPPNLQRPIVRPKQLSTEDQARAMQRILAHERLEQACAELVRAYQAWQAVQRKADTEAT